MSWNSRVNVKHLFTEEEDHKSVQRSMNAVADVLAASPRFFSFGLREFSAIPKDNDFISPVDYANSLLDLMYDFADEHRIWIE